MTQPLERRRSVLQTRDFLWSLLDRRLTPGVPPKLREIAHRLLKHYPGDADLDGPRFTDEDIP